MLRSHGTIRRRKIVLEKKATKKPHRKRKAIDKKNEIVQGGGPMKGSVIGSKKGPKRSSIDFIRRGELHGREREDLLQHELERKESQALGERKKVKFTPPRFGVVRVGGKGSKHHTIERRGGESQWRRKDLASDLYREGKRSWESKNKARAT